jgi:hypothetical protein
MKDREKMLKKLKERGNATPDVGLASSSVLAPPSTLTAHETEPTTTISAAEERGDQKPLDSSPTQSLSDSEELVVPKVTTSPDVPLKLRRVFTVDNEQTVDKTNVAIAGDVVREFNLIKNYAMKKRVKTSTNGIMSNILREWLLKNADEIERTLGYRPYA